MAQSFIIIKFVDDFRILADFFNQSSVLFQVFLATLLFGVIGGIYFLREWITHDHKYRFLLFWAAGLFIMYWFRIPSILAHAGVRFTVTSFDWFFVLSFSMYYLGPLLMFMGIGAVAPLARQERLTRWAWIWFALLVVFFLLHFFGPSMIGRYLPMWISTLFFFLPMQLLLFGSTWKWGCRKDRNRSTRGAVGLLFIMTAPAFLVVCSLLYLTDLLAYPPSFWFVAVTQSPFVPILQSISTAFFVLGFMLAHKDYLTSQERNPLPSGS